MAKTASELQEQGIELFMRHDYEAAADVFRLAQEAYLAEGKRDMAAEMQVNLGLVGRSLGNYDSAVELMNEARQIFAELQDKSREAQVIGNLGGVYMAQGNTEQAATLYREAADTFRDMGDGERYGQTLLAIADIQFKAGKLMQAAATYEIALDHISEPSFRQKLMKQIIGIKNKLVGGGAPPADESTAEPVEGETSGEGPKAQ